MARPHRELQLRSEIRAANAGRPDPICVHDPLRERDHDLILEFRVKGNLARVAPPLRTASCASLVKGLSGSSETGRLEGAHWPPRWWHRGGTEVARGFNLIEWAWVLERKTQIRQFSLHKASLFNPISFIYFDGAGQWPRYCNYFSMSRTVALQRLEGWEWGVWKLICFMNYYYFLPPVNKRCLRKWCGYGCHSLRESYQNSAVHLKVKTDETGRDKLWIGGWKKDGIPELGHCSTQCAASVNTLHWHVYNPLLSTSTPTLLNVPWRRSSIWAFISLTRLCHWHLDESYRPGWE